jgi:hypothetical protein
MDKQSYLLRLIEKAMDDAEILDGQALTISELAEVVADIVAKHYGTHNYEPFMKALNDQLILSSKVEVL